ncbi:MAG TPA: hypothetical protein ENN01_01125 [Halothiobacillus sp.]|nr:hypothetical protein [Halothiobacillus sp.]
MNEAVMQDVPTGEVHDEGLRVVHLPTQLKSLDVIVPYALVAEITEVILPDDEDLARKQAAQIDWRGEKIGLISLETLAGESLPTVGQRVRVAVLYAIGGDSALQYFAILLSGVPRSERVFAESFSKDSPADSPLWRMSAELGGRLVVVPDVIELENRIKALMSK